MAAGAWRRDRLSEICVRAVFFGGLIAMGAYLVGSGG